MQETNNTNHFILQLVGVPAGIKESDITVSHELIHEWQLMDVAKENGENVANITFSTSKKTTSDALEGDVCVKSKLHEVQGLDLFVAAW